ncbi:unnamed protein product [Protopolystoma xenopodis]|uniref:Uncharacterized protein n=1 Tax=Protopolystoma xenopodis TaxID=117903 RepID=A0A448X2S1_9PLAT|nr:unnamed protein product [Protopolystoma xenopodis]
MTSSCGAIDNVEFAIHVPDAEHTFPTSGLPTSNQWNQENWCKCKPSDSNTSTNNACCHTSTCAEGSKTTIEHCFHDYAQE